MTWHTLTNVLVVLTCTTIGASCLGMYFISQPIPVPGNHKPGAAESGTRLGRIWRWYSVGRRAS